MRALWREFSAEGGEIIFGGEELGGCYVQPALVKARAATCRSCRKKSSRRFST